jgi:hypothetical protein
MLEADKADEIDKILANSAKSVDTKGAATALVNKSDDIDVATNAAPVKVIKAACGNRVMPVIHAPPAQGTNSARSSNVLPIIHIPVVNGTDGGASAARTNEKSDGGDAKILPAKHVPVIHWGSSA